eukprot:CAMPEP_0116029412 /NCGR_PEP_ID=MMETSP0321-20121206/16126_1 /TAXON_ID=163516 /ORGANISM="Leptocylindrus danicus var. danicus, Strain B650" /LENGTH=396 /DNA_ID=CAMNT_0003503787 /DNA_START=45 /DNA_END=1235 /DNA_ORIENTATION=+
MSSSNAIVPSRSRSAGSARPKSRGSVPPPTLMCNLCVKPLATTCFLVACDCIFCEDCTYNHFQESSNCPKCGRVLAESDFTELVVTVTDGNRGNDISKNSLQALFSRQKGNSSHGNLPFSDLCFGVIKQLDVVKKSSKFLLKQLLMETGMSNKRYLQSRANQARMKEEITRLKQMHQSQKLQYEQVHADLRNKLQARERDIGDLQATLSKKEEQIEKYRQLHNKSLPTGPLGNPSRGPNMIPGSSAGQRRGHEPPLRALMKQKEANERHQRQLLNQGSSNSGHRLGSSRPPHQQQPTSVLGSLLHQHQHQQHRPFSNASSSNSMPSTPLGRNIRDISSSSGYTFTAAANGGSSNSGKRRRVGPNNMMLSPNTAFAQQHHHTRAQWSAGSSSGFPRR